MELHLKVVGGITIVLAFLHLIFPRYFKWKDDLKDISLINRQLMYVHTFFIALVLLLMGILTITNASDLLTTRLGNNICLALFIFWLFRLVFQFLVYSPQLWKGKRKETIIHILMSILWVYFTGVFLFSFLIGLFLPYRL